MLWRHKILLICTISAVAIVSVLILYLMMFRTEVIKYEKLDADRIGISSELPELHIVPGTITRQKATIRLSNNTEYYVGHSAWWRLERYRRGYWVRVSLLSDQADIVLSIFSLLPGSYIEHSVSFQRSFGRSRLPNGTYRIVKWTSVRDLNDTETGMDVFAEFTISRN